MYLSIDKYLKVLELDAGGEVVAVAERMRGFSPAALVMETENSDTVGFVKLCMVVCMYVCTMLGQRWRGEMFYN